MDLGEELLNQAGFKEVNNNPQGSQQPVAPAQTTTAAPAAAPATAPVETPAATPAPAPAAATPAAAEPAPAAAPTTEPAPAPVQPNDFFKGIAGGRFETLEALNSHIGDLEAKVATEPFANEYIKGLNEAVKNGVDAEVYHQVANVDPKKISDREALILKLQWDSKLTAEEAAQYVDGEYRLGEDENAEDAAVKHARIKAKVEASKARDFITAHRADALTPPIEKIMEKQKAAWTPEVSKVAAQFQSIDIEGKTGKFAFKVAPEVLAKAEKTLLDIMTDGDFKAMPDKKGLELAQNIVRQAVIVESLGQIWDAATDEANKKHAVGDHNPKGVPAATPAPVAPVKSEEQKRAEWLATQYGIKL